MDGFLLVIIDFIVNLFQRISLIEALKRMFVYISKSQTDNQKIMIANRTIDAFVVVKWIFVIVSIKYNLHSWLIIFIVAYLMIMNIHTYFYYHLWSENAIKGKTRSVNHVRRRFITLMQAIGFNVLSFAYIYCTGFRCLFSYTEKYSYWISAIIHSISSTFTGGSNFLTPNNDLGIIIQASQIVTSFIFIGIIFSKDSISLKEGN